LLVSRRAIVDLIRTATLGSYGVAGFVASPVDRLLGWLGFGSPGIHLAMRGPDLRVELFIDVGHGLPVAEVARQVDSAARYAVRQGIGREVGAIAIHVNRLRFETGPNRSSAATGASAGPRPGDLAGSGTDVA
jgi:uncharacterized alkaline shock family protein YloU